MLALVQRGDDRAFDAIVRRHFRMVYAVSLSILANRMDAEDDTQDTFLRALSMISQCRTPERFGGWLSQIARNTARNTARNAVAARKVRHVESFNPEIDMAATESTADRAMETAELGARLEQAIGTLTENQRTVLVLHDMHDMHGVSHAEIARDIGISALSSRQFLHVARTRVRAWFGNGILKAYLHD